MKSGGKSSPYSQFTELWQEQMAQWMKDPQGADVMSQWAKIMQTQGMPGMPGAGEAGMWPPFGVSSKSDDAHTTTNDRRTAGSSDAAMAADASLRMLEQLTGRLAQCEARIAALESALYAQAGTADGGKRGGRED